MIPIQCICPDCMTEFADALEQLPADRPATLNLYCQHNKIAVSASISAGLVIQDWGLFPAATKQAAQAKVTAAHLQQAVFDRAATAQARQAGKGH